MASVLIIDDDASFSTAAAELLRPDGHRVVTANSLSAGRAAVEKVTPEVLLLDLFLPDGSGLELLEELGDRRPRRVAIVTGHPAVKSMISGLSGPGVSYLTKPVDPQEFLSLIAEVEEAPPAEGPSLHFGLLCGESPPVQRVYEKIRQVGPMDSTVFVRGESGTGKELVAEAIHKVSGRGGRFVPVNCGALTRELVSSELFGHEKGSFTGAARRHIGFFEQASGGTLFLDEITEMPLEIQTHLLRVLETERITRVGGEAEIPVDVRLLTATHRDPAKAVSEGVLREDLYYRLQVFPIELPPLRERDGDVERLAQLFLDALNAKHRTARRFSDSALARFRAYDWPGNVRELKHTVHRSYVLASEPDALVEAPERFEHAIKPGTADLRAGRSIKDVEKELILVTLEHFHGDKKAAAATLGVSLKTLYNRLKEYETGSGEEG